MDPKYYESHVTIEPVFDAELEQVKVYAKDYSFKVADLLMQARKDDTPERSKKDTFLTGRDKDYGALYNRMSDLAVDLRKAGFKVWRTKIEAVLYDQRTEA